MNQSDLAQTLAALTGGLRPGPGATRANLDVARNALARALHHGQVVDSIRTPRQLESTAQPEISLEHLEADDQQAFHRLAETVAGEEAPATPPLVSLRTLPVFSHLDPGLPEWARGMRPGQSLGPFI